MPVARLGSAAAFFSRPARIVRGYPTANLRYDLVAGVTVGVILLPQALVFSVMAGLPPQMGLYTAIVASIVGALWGSSNHLHTGPTNTSSLLIFSTVSALAVAGSPAYLAAASLLTLMTGVIRLAMGVLRLGLIVNFVSDSVVVGFTAGAGVLIVVNQTRHLLRLDIASSPGLTDTLTLLAANLGATHLPSALLGAGVIALMVALRRLGRNLPGALIALVIAGLIVWALGLDRQGVRVVGELPRQLPPFVVPPVFDLTLLGRLSTGALALSAIGLVEALSITRSLAARTGQRLDSNQEFVGQGLANLACGFFSGYPVCGSFTRSAVNVEAGARTAMSGVIAGLLALVVVLVFAPLAAYIPLAALAGVVTVSAVGLIDRKVIARIWRAQNARTYRLAHPERFPARRHRSTSSTHARQLAGVRSAQGIQLTPLG